MDEPWGRTAPHCVTVTCCSCEGLAPTRNAVVKDSPFTRIQNNSYSVRVGRTDRGERISDCPPGQAFENHRRAAASAADAAGGMASPASQTFQNRHAQASPGSDLL